MRAGELHRSVMAYCAMAAFALCTGFATAASDSRAPAVAPDGPSWRLVATAPDTGCVVVRMNADVRRWCRGDAFDAGVGVELVAVEAARARFRVGVAGGMPLELIVVHGAPIDLADVLRAREAAAPQPRWVTEGTPAPDGGGERHR